MSKFFVFTLATNAESLGYMPALLASIKSVTKNDFIDKFFILDGGSVDDTAKMIKDLDNDKVTILKSPDWELSSWTWQDLLKQYNFFYRYVESLSEKFKENIYTIYQSSDQVWTSRYSEEIKSVLDKMSSNSEIDYVRTPFRKMINSEYATSIYKYSFNPKDYFTVYGILKFSPGDRRSLVGSETHLTSNREVRCAYHLCKESSISYDMTFFKKEHVEKKIKKHDCGITLKDVDEYIPKEFLSKCYKMNPEKFSIDDHPEEVRDMISKIQSDQFGFDCFGHFRKT